MKKIWKNVSHLPIQNQDREFQIGNQLLDLY